MGRVWIRMFSLPHKILLAGTTKGLRLTTGLQSLNKDFQTVASMIRLAGDKRSRKPAREGHHMDSPDNIR